MTHNRPRITAADLEPHLSRIYLRSELILGNTDMKSSEYDATVLHCHPMGLGMMRLTTTAGSLICEDRRVFEVCTEATLMDDRMPAMARKVERVGRSVD